MKTGLTQRIVRSKRDITILFTDIVDSTGIWEKQGDIRARILVDRHNRLLFAVIKKYHGRVVKTIGDSIMATFKAPEDAVHAAIGMQQAVHSLNKNIKEFNFNIRIGIHSGPTLVEKDDIFGDAVNIASRVENLAQAGEILVSDTVAEKLDKVTFKLLKGKKFTPKGKSQRILVYRCEWDVFPSLVADINFDSIIPVLARQRWEFLLYSLSTLLVIYTLFNDYVRYLITDNKNVGFLNYSAKQILHEHPDIALSVIGTGLVLAVAIRYLRTLPLYLFRFTKGFFGFLVAFQISIYSLSNFPAEWVYQRDAVLYESTHLFVEVLEDDVSVYSTLSISSETLLKVSKNQLLLLADVVKDDGITWNKVFIDEGRYGWIERIRPAEIGEPEKRVTISNKFYFRYLDLYAFLLGLSGFVWGFFSFSFKPF
ncbi:MAG: adenylate/guanylate cyclase domain-containing protein [Gammaproteobacteria bacterium]|nr:adenylate/guanylate cyclase domain-containing protein [Gammaproteobacteria bacterium]